MRAALQDQRLGLIDNWLRQVQTTSKSYAGHLASIADEGRRVDRLCELNVIHQVLNAAETTVIKAAWQRGQALSIHGWIYGLTDGLVRCLDINLSGAQDLAKAIDANWEAETDVAKLEATGTSSFGNEAPVKAPHANSCTTNGDSTSNNLAAIAHAEH